MFRLAPLFLLGTLSLRAELTVAPLFGDHAVLHRDKPVPIWKTATPETKVSITFAELTKTSPTVEWMVILP